jgi:hypothetical protein
MPADFIFPTVMIISIVEDFTTLSIPAIESTVVVALRVARTWRGVRPRYPSHFLRARVGSLIRSHSSSPAIYVG